MIGLSTKSSCDFELTYINEKVVYLSAVQLVGHIDLGSPAVVDGVLYLGNDDGYLYAIE